ELRIVTRQIEQRTVVSREVSELSKIVSEEEGEVEAISNNNSWKREEKSVSNFKKDRE
ncbi:unnamed protein product, partial [Sphagnum compactum]